jgi:phage terminase small subunit
MNPPDRLTAEQKAKWNEVVPRVDEACELADVLEQYVIEWCRWQEAEAWLRENGEVLTLRNDKGVVKNLIQAPQLRVSRDSAKIVKELSEILF